MFFNKIEQDYIPAFLPKNLNSDTNIKAGSIFQITLCFSWKLEFT